MVSEHLMQAPVLLFIGMMAFFSVGVIYGLIAEGLSER
jgi:hypothetical protein